MSYNPDEELIERLADAEHASWAHWMAYLFSLCYEDRDGNIVIPRNSADRWQKQMTTPYAELSEQEKESDRGEVWKILPIIRDAHDDTCGECTWPSRQA